MATNVPRVQVRCGANVRNGFCKNEAFLDFFLSARVVRLRVARNVWARTRSFLLSTTPRLSILTGLLRGVLALPVTDVMQVADSHYGHLTQQDWLPSTTNMTMSSAGLDELLARFRTDSGEVARSIAVVGSSGNLLFRGYGVSIDEADVVLRVNDATTAGYELDVGSRGCDASASGTRTREHVRVGFSAGLEHAAERDQLCSGTYVAVTSAGGMSPQASDLRAAESAGADGGVLISWEFMEAAQAAVTTATSSNWPSTGFLALCIGLAVARHLGARLTAFGFGACEPCGKYCDCDGSNATRGRQLGLATEAEARANEAAGNDGIHPFATEAKVRARWAADGHITLVEPTCDGYPSYDDLATSVPPNGKPVLFDDVDPLAVIGAAVVLLVAVQAIPALCRSCGRRGRREKAADGAELPECEHDVSAWDLRANDAASAARLAQT